MGKSVLTTIKPELRIKIDARPHDGIHAFGASLGRTNAFLGVNGSGKSRLLRDIFDGLKERTEVVRPLWDRKPVFLDGHRYATLPNSIPNDRLQSISQASVYISDQRASSADRLVAGLIILKLREEEEAARFRQEYKNWKAGKSPEPIATDSSLERLRGALHEILPHLTLSYEVGARSFICCRDGLSYPLADISDGEKQVFGALTEVFMLADTNSVVMVDEPESHLHPELACRFWDVVEQKLIDAIFFYATHSLAFAMRSGLEKIFVLDKDFNSQPKEVSPYDLATLSAAELKDFLGAIAGITTTSKALVVEGRKSSLDRRLYRWLLPESDVQIFDLNESTSVEKAVRGTGVWRMIAPQTRVVGIVDRDYRSPDEIAKLEKVGCVVAEMHEAESYFCIPKLLEDLLVRTGASERKSASDFESEIVSIAKVQSARIAGTRTEQRFWSAIDVNYPASAENRDQIRDALKNSYADAISKIGTSDDMLAVFDKECEQIDSAIASSDITSLLKLIPGALCLEALAKFAGLSSSEKVINAAIEVLKPDAYPHLVDLQKKLRCQFEATQ